MLLLMKFDRNVDEFPMEMSLLLQARATTPASCILEHARNLVEHAGTFMLAITPAQNGIVTCVAFMKYGSNFGRNFEC
jgi:hypothetical protein